MLNLRNSSLSFAACTYMRILFLPCGKTAQNQLHCFCFPAFFWYAHLCYLWLTPEEGEMERTGYGLPCFSISFNAIIFCICGRSRQGSNTNKKICDRVPILLECPFITFFLYLMQVLIQAESVARRTDAYICSVVEATRCPCSRFAFCWTPRQQGSIRIPCWWDTTNTMKKGQQGMVDTRTEWGSPLLIFKLHCPIRLHLPNTSSKTKLFKFSDINSTDIKPSTGSSDCRVPCNGAGFTPMKVTLVILLSSLKSSWDTLQTIRQWLLSVNISNDFSADYTTKSFLDLSKAKNWNLFGLQRLYHNGH